MSVNDSHHWLADEMRLIRSAVPEFQFKGDVAAGDRA